MTGETLKTMCETILDDTIDDVLFYQLANVAKNRIEDIRPWMMLRSLDSSQTATAGNTSTTSRALPTSWRRTYKLMVGRDMPFEQVPFDEQHIWRNSANKFCVDVANSVYYLLGSIGSAETIYHYYIKSTSDIAAAISPVWPERFHPIIAYDVASYIMAGVDADEEFSRMAGPNQAAHQALLKSMESWDTDLQLAAQGGRAQVEGMQGGIDLALM